MPTITIARLAPLAAVALTLAAAPASAQELRLLTEEYPPYNFTRDGEVVGLGTDLVRAIMEETGTAHKIEVLPWARAFATARDEANTCLFSAARTPEREEMFAWVGPLDSSRYVAVVTADDDRAVAAVEELEGLKVGTYNGDAVDAFLRNAGLSPDAVRQDDLNVKKLKAGRIDVWATFEDRYLQEGDEGLRPLFTFNEINLMLACNTGVPAETLAAFQTALDGLEASGRAEEIRASYDK